MLVIISVSRLDNRRIEIGVIKPQHDSDRRLEYGTEEEVREALSTFGISTETIDLHLKMLTEMGANERLKFSPIDVPQHSLLSLGFRF
jgi:hypothetical protein